MQVTCSKFTERNTGALRGHANLELPDIGLHLYGCALFEKDGRRWISLPTRDYTGQDGKKAYLKMGSFPDKTIADQFNSAAITAIEAFQNNVNTLTDSITGAHDDVPF